MAISNYKFYQSLGICPSCRKNGLMGDEKMCPECLAYFAMKNKEYYDINGRKNKDSFNKSRREIHQYRIEHHLCTRCGVKISSSKKKCPKCLEKDRLINMEHRYKMAGGT